MMMRFALAAALCAGYALGAQSSLTGCLDEQAGARYVLRGGPELSLLALLEPGRGFTNQGFAKYLGSKVTVSGELEEREGRKVMKVRAVRKVAGVCAPAGGTASREEAPPPAKAGPGKPATVTGCLDELPGPEYVLRGDDELALVMKLEPQGFPVTGFARYLGRKVELRGRVYQQGETRAMKVTSIRTLAEVCAP